MFTLLIAALMAAISQTSPLSVRTAADIPVLPFVTSAQQANLDTTFAVPATGRVELDMNSGSLSITTWDRNAMRIRSRGGRSDRLDIEREGGVVSIEPDDARGWQNLHLEIVVPRRWGLKIDGVHVPVTVDGLQGDVDIENVEGAITISNVSGPVAVESVSGDVVVTGVRGDVSVNTTNKAIRLDDIRGNIEAETVNGSITMLRVDAARVEASTVQGIVEYYGTIRDGGRYYLGTHNGRITLAVPEQASARISVDTHNGKVESAFPVQIRTHDGGEYSITLGGGSARIQLESFNGSVYLVRPGNR